MGEFAKYLRLLWRYRLVVIIVPLITVMITFYIVRNLPDVYGAPTQIATGIVDETQQMAFSDASSLLQESRINQKFVNLIETVKSKSLIDQVSYQLILHDLTSPKPFKNINILYQKGLNKAAIDHAIEVYREKYKNKEALNLQDHDQQGLSTVISWMGYDYGAIIDKLSIYRLSTSDFIFVDFESPNADLSAYVVNTIVQEFIKDYTHLVRANQVASVDFLKNLMKIKLDTLSNRVNALRDYKISNRILNLDEQSNQVLTQIAGYEAQLQESEKEIASVKGTIANIDRKFSPDDRQYAEALTATINQQLLGSREKLRQFLDSYKDSDFDEKFRAPIDSLQRVITSQISNITDQNASNPLSTRDALVGQKLGLQLRYDIASYGITPIRNKIAELNRRFTTLVPHEAALQTFQRDIDIVTKEYQDLLTQYNQINMESQIPVKLRQVQLAMPGAPKPSKKMLLVILSGIASGTFCLIVFFVIFFLDDRIRKPAELAHVTRLPVLGYLNLVGKSTLDLKSIWKNLHGTPEMMEFKRQLRSARFEVSRGLSKKATINSPMVSITSINEGEGKTLLSACIAYTYVMVNKRVLLIDGNFDHPSITTNSNTTLFLEDFLKTGDLGGADFNTGIMVMGNHGGDNSLMEVCDENLIKARFEMLKSKFDIIMVETPSLQSLNKAKEWISMTDGTICIFEANQSLSETKKQHVHYLSTINGKFLGWIVNKVRYEGRSTSQTFDSATVID